MPLSMTRFGRRARMLASSVSLAGTESGSSASTRAATVSRPASSGRRRSRTVRLSPTARLPIPHSVLTPGRQPVCAMRGAQRLGPGAAAGGLELDVGGRRGAVVDHPQAPGAGNAHGVGTAGRLHGDGRRRRSARVAAGRRGQRAHADVRAVLVVARVAVGVADRGGHRCPVGERPAGSGGLDEGADLDLQLLVRRQRVDAAHHVLALDLAVVGWVHRRQAGRQGVADHQVGCRHVAVVVDQQPEDRLVADRQRPGAEQGLLDAGVDRAGRERHLVAVVVEVVGVKGQIREGHDRARRVRSWSPAVPALSGARVPWIVITRSSPGPNWGMSQAMIGKSEPGGAPMLSPVGS